MKKTTKAAKARLDRPAEKKVTARTLRDDDLTQVSGGGTGKAKTTVASEVPKETVTFEYGGLQVR